MDACLGGVRINGPSLPPGVTLDLNFMNPGTLDPRITFTRASTAAYIDVNGFIQMAATNAPRWDYDPVTHALRGVLIEEQRTNIALQSGNLADPAWSTFNQTAIAPVQTANQTTAPDGTLTGTRVVYPAVTGAGSASVIQQLTTFTANSYVFSVWLKGAAGGEQIYLNLNVNGFINSARLVLTTQWQRFSVVATAVAGVAGYAIGADLRGGTATNTPAQTIYAWGAQAEQGGFQTSYIGTTSAAVTRAVDSAVVLPANMGWFTSPGGSWLAEFIAFNPTPPAGGARIIAWPVVGSSAPVYLAPGNQLGQYDGGGGPVTANAITVNAVTKGATAFTPTTGRNCLNGGTVASGAMTTGYPGLPTNGVVFMANATITDGASGYIRRVSYWPRVLSDTEMQQVTT